MSRDLFIFRNVDQEWNEREERLDIAKASIKEHDEQMKLRQSRATLHAALVGVRGLAEIEARNGSRVWVKAVDEINRCLKEAGYAE